MSEENAGRVSEERLRVLIAHWESFPPSIQSIINVDTANALAELLALRAADHPAVGVRIKPLEWVKSNAGERWTAQYAFGQFEITRILYDTEDGRQYSWRRGICSEYFNTLDEAQAAAQTDYERRILSCIEPLRPATEQAGGEMEDMETVTRQMHAEAKAILHGQPKRFPSPAATQSAVVSEALREALHFITNIDNAHPSVRKIRAALSNPGASQ